MTLVEAGEIFAYWAANPPPHLLLQGIAGALGWRPPPPSTGSAADLAAAPPPGLIVTRGAPAETPAAVLDPEALRDRNRARAAAIARRNKGTAAGPMPQDR
jgi:hypothetical protein